MIVIVRSETNEVINDRQSSDFQPFKQAIIDQIEAQIPTLPPEEQDKLQLHLDKLKDDRANYYARRVQAIVKSFGGQPGDYAVVNVPTEQETDVMTAQYVTYDGHKLTCIAPQKPVIRDSVLTVPGRRWLRGNYTMKEDAVMDFKTLKIEALTWFRICAYTSHDGIDFVLFTRAEHEEYKSTDVPGAYYLGLLCEGTVTPEYQIAVA